jgi:hypothetical protein
VVGANPALANLVQDSSFESSLIPERYYGAGQMGSWTVRVLGDQVGIYQSDAFLEANVTDGNYAFDLGMGGNAAGNRISQVLPTVAGLAYRLSFDWGSEYARGTSAFVSVGNLNRNLFDPARAEGDYDSTPWIVNSSSFPFVASGNDTLTFREPAAPFDWYGLALDNVVVVQVSPPQLTIIRSAAKVILSWSTNATGFVLQSATTLSNGGDWQDYPTPPTEINAQKVVSITPAGLRGFFRLRKP